MTASQFAGETVEVARRRFPLTGVDQSGDGAVSLWLGPPWADEWWEVTEVGVQSTSVLAGALVASIGDASGNPVSPHSTSNKGTPNTWTGSTTLAEGETLLIVWSNLTPGAQVTATFSVIRKRRKGSPPQAY